MFSVSKEYIEVESTKIVLKHDASGNRVTCKPPNREKGIFDSHSDGWAFCFFVQIIDSFGYFTELILGVGEGLEDKISSIEIWMSEKENAPQATCCGEKKSPLA
jgi:hypothetical protein